MIPDWFRELVEWAESSGIKPGETVTLTVEQIRELANTLGELAPPSK